MNECFFNPRRKKYKRTLKPSAKILANLKKRKMLNVSSNNDPNDQCDFLFMASNGTIEDKWFLDSCCARHITNKRDNMMHYRRMNGNNSINAVCQDGEMKIVGIGNIRVQKIIDGKKVVSMLKDVAYVPSCRANLIPLTLAQQRGLDVRYKGGGTNMVATYKGKVAMIGDSKETNISELTGSAAVSSRWSDIAFFNPGKDYAMKLMHRRTCHTSMSTLKRMHETKAVNELDKFSSLKDNYNVFEACVEGKATNAPHK